MVVLFPVLSIFAMEPFLGNREMTLAACGKGSISEVDTNIKIITFACSLQPNKKVKAGKRLIVQPYIWSISQMGFEKIFSKMYF